MIIGQNTIKKACKIFIEIHGEECLKTCTPPDGVNILLFSQLVVFYHSVLNEPNYESRILRGCIQSSQVEAKKKLESSEEEIGSDSNEDSGYEMDTNQNLPLAKIMVGDKHHPLCVPGNSYITLPGKIRAPKGRKIN